MQYSVVSKLWSEISNSVGFWKQSCIIKWGEEIVAAKWTPQLVAALENSQMGASNLLVPTIKGIFQLVTTVMFLNAYYFSR